MFNSSVGWIYYKLKQMGYKFLQYDYIGAPIPKCNDEKYGKTKNGNILEMVDFL